MIDTFELSTQLSATFGQIASRFNTTIDNFVQRNQGVYELIDPLMHVGVQRVKIKQVRDKLFKQVTIVFNPSAIINGNLTPLLFIPTEENVEYLKQVVDSILKEIQLSHKQWCVTRIDYAFQFKTEYHSLYPFLVSKGPCSSTTIQEFKEGSLHRRNGNSILNMYSNVTVK